MDIRRAFAALCLLAGCAQTPTASLDATGAFAISKSEAGDSAGILIAQNKALEQARAFCGARGQEFRQLGAGVGDARANVEATYTVRFMCFDRKAPDISRPTYIVAPDPIL